MGYVEIKGSDAVIEEAIKLLDVLRAQDSRHYLSPPLTIIR